MGKVIAHGNDFSKIWDYRLRKDRNMNAVHTPALDALLYLANTRPGFEMCNYSSYKSYRADARKATQDLRKVQTLYREAKKIGVNDEDILRATSGGSLVFKNGSWHYLTGQYYPVEYRGSIKRAIEDAIAKNRQNNAASVPVPDFRTVEDVKRYSKKVGRYYFHPDAVKYFRSIIHTRTLIHGRYFIESTQRTDDEPRMYKVLAVNRASGSIEHLDHIGEFLTYKEALEAVPVT